MKRSPEFNWHRALSYVASASNPTGTLPCGGRITSPRQTSNGCTCPQFTYSSSPSRRKRASSTVAYFSPTSFSVKNRFTARHHIEQRHPRTQVRINHSLQRGSQQRRRDSLAAHIRQHHRQAFFGVHCIKEVSTNFLTRKIFPIAVAQTALQESSPASAAAECWRQSSTPAGTVGLLLSLHQTRVFDQRSGFCRDRSQNVVADSGKFPRRKARIHI